MGVRPSLPKPIPSIGRPRSPTFIDAMPASQYIQQPETRHDGPYRIRSNSPQYQRQYTPPPVSTPPHFDYSENRRGRDAGPHHSRGGRGDFLSGRGRSRGHGRGSGPTRMKSNSPQYQRQYTPPPASPPPYFDHSENRRGRDAGPHHSRGRGDLFYGRGRSRGYERGSGPPRVKSNSPQYQRQYTPPPASPAHLDYPENRRGRDAGSNHTRGVGREDAFSGRGWSRARGSDRGHGSGFPTLKVFKNRGKSPIRGSSSIRSRGRGANLAERLGPKLSVSERLGPGRARGGPKGHGHSPSKYSNTDSSYEVPDQEPSTSFESINENNKRYSQCHESRTVEICIQLIGLHGLPLKIRKKSIVLRINGHAICHMNGNFVSLRNMCGFK